MIRIRCIHSSAFPLARERIAQVGEIFRQNFPNLADYAAKVPHLVDHPFEHGYRTVLLVLETGAGRVNAFALLEHFPQVSSSFLDFIASRRDVRGSGMGAALYEAVRQYCHEIGSRGLYMEVQPDDAELTPDPEQLEAARRRLRFYERYGARPILHTAYPTPVGHPPTTAYLVFDGLGRTEPLGRAEARAAVRMILNRRFGHVADPAYVNRIVESFVDDPVRLRPPRYVRAAGRPRPVGAARLEKPFALVSSQRHVIHHVQQRGYFERPARVGVLVEAATRLGLFSPVAPRPFGETPVLAVHERAFVRFLQAICLKLRSDRPVYPDTFPIRRPDRRPRNLPQQAGYYCIDSCTPLDHNAYRAARAAVDVALTGAAEILAGRRAAYAVCRPPGHHAERTVYGGFCYFNNAAVAAQYLSRSAKVAVLDIDFHHGNGTQDIFYRRADVLTASLHGHPDHAFPYFSGFADETGEGPGTGFNRNFPLPRGTGDKAYLAALEKALGHVRRFAPAILVVSLGLDTLRGDPTGTFALTAGALGEAGRRIAGLGVPVLVVQEGGYDLRSLRRGSAAFFTGLAGAGAGAGA